MWFFKRKKNNFLMVAVVSALVAAGTTLLVFALRAWFKNKKAKSHSCDFEDCDYMFIEDDEAEPIVEDEITEE